MKVKVVLFGQHAQLLPPDRSGQLDASIDAKKGAKVADVLDTRRPAGGTELRAAQRGAKRAGRHRAGRRRSEGHRAAWRRLKCEVGPPIVLAWNRVRADYGRRQEQRRDRHGPGASKVTVAMPRPARSRKGGIPLYYQIMRDLKEQILSGKLGPGDRLPSEAEQTRRFGVSRVVIRQALRILEEQGLIVRVKGKGTFVSEKVAEDAAPRISGSLEDLIHIGADITIRVVEFRSGQGHALTSAEVLPATEGRRPLPRAARAAGGRQAAGPARQPCAVRRRRLHRSAISPRSR